VKLGLLPESEARRIAPVLTEHHLPIHLREPLSLTTLMAAVARDKKVRGGMPRFIVLPSLGHAETKEGIDRGLIENAFVNIGARRD
jgi:3-dehydroquinate synthetase